MSDIGKIQQREITDEMSESYLDYAMSVIVARALPDVRDGLKPVHRRILYTMHEMGLGHTAKFRKSAAVVGTTLAHYHPHGDMAVYDSIVRMAQDFALRYPLVDGQGNFGSIDGDNAAAQRYTEVRMTRIAEETLKDIEKDTVDFRPNYDGTREEPLILPSTLPNLLLNGTVGIAVGMATNIPPHNASEVLNGLTAVIDNPKLSSDELTEYIKGPDFPTGGIIYNEKDIKAVYAAGKGAILNRGKAEIEETKKGITQVVITEIPYQVNKSELIEKIAELVHDKKLEGVKDVRDESDREGLRIAIDLKPDAHPQKILNTLYKRTDLEKNFHLNLLALVDGIQPQVLSLKNVLEEFIKHRENVVTRRTRFDLLRAKERIHILEGLKKALDNIDRIIDTIKKSEDREAAHANLVKKFDFTDSQANAILEMRLQTLAGLERQKIDNELKEKLALARELDALLADPQKITRKVKDDFLELKEKYGDERKTKIIKSSPKEISEADLIPEEDVLIVLTRGGYVKRIRPESYRTQKRGGKGLIGMETKEEDVVEHILVANTHSSLLFFTNAGKVYRVPAYDVPEGTRTSKGKIIFNFLSLSQSERVTSVLSIPSEGKKQKNSSISQEYSKYMQADGAYIVMITKRGIIKKVDRNAFDNVRKSGLIAIGLKKDDELRWAHLTGGNDEIIIVTRDAQSVRFSEKDVRAMGRQATGVIAIRLGKNDEIVGSDVIDRAHKAMQEKLLVIMENGYGKQTLLSQYKRQRRGGSGIKTSKTTSKTGKVVDARIVHVDEEELVTISKKGQVIRTQLAAIPTHGRATQGVRIMRMDEGDSVASITTL